MQHFVVLPGYAIKQRDRGARHVYGGTRHPGGGDFSSEAIIASGELPCSCIRRNRRKRSLFGGHDREHDPGRLSGSQPPDNLSRLAKNSGLSTHRNAMRIPARQNVVPDSCSTTVVERTRRQHHRAGRGDTIGAAGVAGVLKANNGTTRPRNKAAS